MGIVLATSIGMESLWNLSWRAYPAIALMALGVAVVARGVWRQRRGIALPVTRAAKGAAMTRALRSVLAGLATIGIGVAWWHQLDLLLIVSLVIGGEELLETSVVIAALDDAERRRVWDAAPPVGTRGSYLGTP